MKEPFLNPYNFVPAFPRDGLPEELRDAPPPGHDRLRPEPDRWTGRIGVTLTVETPLLLLDTVRATSLDEKNNPGHLHYPVRLRNGRPYLAPTAVKGMLRSAFEMITNSRMGVFAGHDERLAFRHPPEDAQQLRPVKLTRDRVVPLEEAKLPRYPGAKRHVMYTDGSTPKHRDAVVAIIDGKNRVVRLAKKGAQRLPEPNGRKNERRVTGFLYITGRNIKHKKDERLFYETKGARSQQLDKATWQALTAEWEALIRDYRAAHTEQEILHRQRPGGGDAHAGEWLSDEPGMTAWSPHLYEHLYGTNEDRYLPPRTPLLCWARYEDDKIVKLYPVKVSRDLYDAAPRELIHPSLVPAPDFNRLSPADRVFGWVAEEGSGHRPAAYRGRLRIGPVTCDHNAEQAVRTFPGEGLPLAILGQPKPQQVRFYVSKSQDEPNEPIKKDQARAEQYKKTQGLRGWKHYPHQAGLPDGYWEEPNGEEDPTQVLLAGGRYREFRRPRLEGTEQRDTQNRSIGGWIQPQTVFRFTIEVRDLDRTELGALAWILTLDKSHFHRLGLGKPLGFGSVRLTIDQEKTELSSGDQWTAYYRSLSGPLATTNAERTLKSAAESYAALVDSSPQLSTVRDAFLTAARGFPDIPVHYPRNRPADLPHGMPTPPDPSGKVYEWFAANERTDRGKILRGRGQVLPPLDHDAPQLTTYRVEKQDKKKQKNGQNRGNRGNRGQSNNRRNQR